MFKKAMVILSIAVVIYWLPFFIVVLMGQPNIVSSVYGLPDSDAVIIFGTLVNDGGEITPLLRERLEAGIAIFQAGKSRKIVVSNTENAAKIMAKYLYENGIPADVVEIDTQAEKTTDTCEHELEKHSGKRRVLFVSQGFHLFRLLYQCNTIGVHGIAFRAEALDTISHSQESLLTVFFVRTGRYIREAGLTWLAFLHIY